MQYLLSIGAVEQGTCYEQIRARTTTDESLMSIDQIAAFSFDSLSVRCEPVIGSCSRDDQFVRGDPCKGEFRLLVTFLSTLKCEVEAAAGAYEALQKMAARRTDLVLLDLRMDRHVRPRRAYGARKDLKPPPKSLTDPRDAEILTFDVPGQSCEYPIWDRSAR